MFKVIILFSVFTGILVLGEDRIVGGNPAYPGQFPYQISLRYASSNSHTCGGTIISSRFIVTAAHCVYEANLNDLFIVVGTTSLNQGGIAYHIESAVYHASYSPENMLNDIAIIKVDRDIQFNSNVQPIPLQTSEIPAGSMLVLSGWGLTSYPGNIPNNLQYAQLTAISSSECYQELYPGVITNSQICTYTRPGQGACQGDSGGPLVYGGRLSGVVSWGRPCAQGYPDVFTKVASFYNWIQNVVQS